VVEGCKMRLLRERKKLNEDAESNIAVIRDELLHGFICKLIKVDA
jgi:hypothetical protein